MCIVNTKKRCNEYTKKRQKMEHIKCSVKTTKSRKRAEDNNRKKEQRQQT